MKTYISLAFLVSLGCSSTDEKSNPAEDTSSTDTDTQDDTSDTEDSSNPGEPSDPEGDGFYLHSNGITVL